MLHSVKRQHSLKRNIQHTADNAENDIDNIENCNMILQMQHWLPYSQNNILPQFMLIIPDQIW